MPSKDFLPLPDSAPHSGEVYRHYKGDLYKVVLLALNTTDSEWMVIYEPLYSNPAAPFFARPLREWHEIVELDGQKIKRFCHILPK